MSKQQLNAAIAQVADTTNTTKEEISKKLFAKDNWTWFLVRQAAA